MRRAGPAADIAVLQGFVGLWEAAWVSSKRNSISSPKAAKGRPAAWGRLTQPLAKRLGNVSLSLGRPLSAWLCSRQPWRANSPAPPPPPRLLKIRVNRKTVGGAFLCP